ncbi:MAG: hypothetical protein ACR2GL_04085 [Thermoleophilaceae bacterium]
MLLDIGHDDTHERRHPLGIARHRQLGADEVQQAAERAKARVDQAWLEQQGEGLEAMSPEQRQAVLAEHEQRFGPYGGQRWQLEQRIRDLAEAKQTAEAHGGDQQDEKRQV